VIVFVVFVHSTVRSMRVSYVIRAVHGETAPVLEAMFRPASQYRLVEESQLVAEPVVLNFGRPAAVLDGIDASRLVDLARADDIVFRFRNPIGAYLVEGAPFIEVHGGDAKAPNVVLACLDCAPVRAVYQDPCYGIRQLVDIAIRALSPAVNDPTTAVQVMDRLEGLLMLTIQRPDPTGHFIDDDGVVRLIVPVPTWVHVFELALTELRCYGASAPQVSRRLMALYDRLLVTEPSPSRASIIVEHRQALVADVGAVYEGRPAGAALVPDPLGLG
jgi:uncharacterized membrane protein